MSARERLDRALGAAGLDSQELYPRAPYRSEFVDMVDVVLDELVQRLAEQASAAPSAAVPDPDGTVVERAARAWHEAAEARDRAEGRAGMGPWASIDPVSRAAALANMTAALAAARGAGDPASDEPLCPVTGVRGCPCVERDGGASS